MTLDNASTRTPSKEPIVDEAAWERFIEALWCLMKLESSIFPLPVLRSVIILEEAILTQANADGMGTIESVDRPGTQLASR